MSIQHEEFQYASKLLEEVQGYSIENKEELEAYRIAFLGTKGKIKDLFKRFRNVPNELKKEFGQLANTVKQTAEQKFMDSKGELDSKSALDFDIPDLSRPAGLTNLGSRHPVSLMINRICEIFSRIGFVVKEGPEIEDDWHNFTALNTPEDHPAREMQDTFYLNTQLNPAMLLRTHTSPAQARTMQVQKPPIRIIVPGRVYRNETISARSHCQFHQVEGLYVDEKVSFADLKQTLLYFAKEMYGATRIRLRPSYFPFTEPSAEMDVYWGLETEADYRITKGTGWLEVLGCGMVDPNVLENCGIDSNKYSGFAFGMGIDRQAMLKYNINDIRLLFESDVRFLRQFASVY